MSISLSQEELRHAHPWKIWINSKVKEGVLPQNDYLCCQYHPGRIKNKYYNLILISHLTAISKIKIHHNTKQLVKNVYLASARKWEREMSSGPTEAWLHWVQKCNSACMHSTEYKHTQYKEKYKGLWMLFHARESSANQSWPFVLVF